MNKSGSKVKGKNKNQNAILAIVAVVAIISVVGIALAYQGGVFHLASIAPGFEGLQFYIYGFSKANLQPATAIGTQLQAPFSWASSGTNNAIIQANDPSQPWSNQPFAPIDYQNHQIGQLNVQLSYTSTDVLNPIQQIDYYVLQSSGAHNTTSQITNSSGTYSVTTTTYTNTWEHVVGYVVPAYFTLNLFSVPGSGEYDFQGQQIWLVGQTQVWNHAMIDPSNPGSTYQAAYSIPLAGVINYYTVNGYYDANRALQTVVPLWVINHAQLSPQNNGVPLTFFTGASTAGADPGALYLSPSQIQEYMLNASLAGNPSPDTRFKQQIFTPITLANFGGSDNGGIWALGQAQIGYPSVTYNVKVYYLMLGKFLFQVDNAVNSTLPIFENQNTTVTPTLWDQTVGVWLNGISQWFSNPFNQIMFAITIMIIGIVAVIAFLVFTGIGRALDKSVSSRSSGGK